MRHIDTFLGRLTGVVRQGAGWRACCPTHDDSSASLMVSLGFENRILFYCHVCGKDKAARNKILAAMGIRWGDTYAKGKVAYERYLPQASRTRQIEEMPEMDLDRRNQAYTYLTRFQGLAADGAKIALWRLHQAGFRIVGFIHDEIVVEILDDGKGNLEDKEAIERIVKEAMASVLQCDISVEVEGVVAESWVK